MLSETSLSEQTFRLMRAYHKMPPEARDILDQLVGQLAEAHRVVGELFDNSDMK